jgi:BON domain-containing protein
MDRQKLGLLGSVGVAAGLGAGLMYLLDPQGGGRRRALARDKTVSVLKKGGDAALKTSRDLGNRTKGLVAEAGSRLRRSAVDDQVLRDRVRAKLGRVVSHPSAIDVTACDGCVVLSGPVLASEVDDLLKTAVKVKGVEGVENRLEVHESAGNHPALQGNGREASGKWSPTKRLLAGTAGGALALAGLQRRDRVGAAMSSVGLGLLARGFANRSLPSLNGGSVKSLLHRRRGESGPSSESLEFGTLDQAEHDFQTSLP